MIWFLQISCITMVAVLGFPAHGVRHAVHAYPQVVELVAHLTHTHTHTHTYTHTYACTHILQIGFNILIQGGVGVPASSAYLLQINSTETTWLDVSTIAKSDTLSEVDDGVAVSANLLLFIYGGKVVNITNATDEDLNHANDNETTYRVSKLARYANTVFCTHVWCMYTSFIFICLRRQVHCFWVVTCFESFGSNAGPYTHNNTTPREHMPTRHPSVIKTRPCIT
jgi:hypothetical protein